MVRIDSLSVRLPIAAISALCIVLIDILYDYGLIIGADPIFILGVGIALFACLYAYLRAGLHGPAFWFTIAAAFVLVSPLFAYALGYHYYSELTRQYQSMSAMSIAILEGSLAVVILAVLITPHPVAAYSYGKEAFRIQYGPFTSGLGLLGSCVALVFCAWLTDNGPILGLADYAESRTNEFSDVRFAGGAWALFSVLAAYFYLGIRRAKGTFVLRALFYLSIAVSLVWLLLHGRRSETLGFILFLFCILSSPRKAISSPGTGRRILLPDFLTLRTMALVTIVGLSAAIGYYRTTLTWQFTKSDYVQPPGGAGNNLLTYLASFDIAHRSGFGIYPGETYVNHLKNLPPQFVGLDRSPDAYMILSKKIRLIGGQYWLMEPVMNFGGLGIAVYSVLIAFLASCSIRGIRRCLFNSGGLGGFLQGGVFISLMFRTLWYGPSAAINGEIMALLAVGSIFVLSKLGGQRAARFRTPTAT